VFDSREILLEASPADKKFKEIYILKPLSFIREISQNILDI